MKIGFVLLILVFLNVAGPAKAVDNESVYDRVLRTGVIRCGYIIYPPQIQKDPATGALYGLAYDVMEAVAKELGFKVEWTEEVGTGTFVEALKNGRFDMLCNTAYDSAARARYVSYSVPVFFTPIVAVARQDDDRFARGLEAINVSGIRISVVDGSSYSVIAREYYPKAQAVSLPDMTDFTQTLMEVIYKKADIAFSDKAIALSMMAKNPAKLKIVGDKPLRFYSNVFAYRRGEEAFGGMIDVAIRNLDNFGMLESIMIAHEEHPGSFYRAAPPYREPKM